MYTSRVDPSDLVFSLSHRHSYISFLCNYIHFVFPKCSEMCIWTKLGLVTCLNSNRCILYPKQTYRDGQVLHSHSCFQWIEWGGIRHLTMTDTGIRYTQKDHTSRFWRISEDVHRQNVPYVSRETVTGTDLYRTQVIELKTLGRNHITRIPHVSRMWNELILDHQYYVVCWSSTT